MGFPLWKRESRRARCVVVDYSTTYRNQSVHSAGGPRWATTAQLSNVMQPPVTPVVFGITSPSLLARGADPEQPFVRFGLFTVLAGSPDAPVVCCYDDAGRVNRYKRLRPLTSLQYIPIANPDHVRAPALGEDYEQAAIFDAEKPDDITVGAWHQVATLMAEDYGTVRDGVVSHPLEGYHVAKFFSETAVNLSRNSGAGFDVEAAASKISQMAHLRTALFSRHPEWSRSGEVQWPEFAKASGPSGLDLSN